MFYTALCVLLSASLRFCGNVIELDAEKRGERPTGLYDRQPRRPLILTFSCSGNARQSASSHIPRSRSRDSASIVLARKISVRSSSCPTFTRISTVSET